MLHGVCQYMLQLDFTPCFLSHNVEQINLWHIIELTIVNGMRQFISIGKFHTDQKPSWFLSDIRHLINCLHTLCYRFRNNPTNSTDDKIKALETLLQEMINESKSDNACKKHL